MNEKLMEMIETAINIKETFSYDDIRLTKTEDFAMATISVRALNDLNKLNQMANGFEMRLIAVNDNIEIRLYLR